MERMLQVLTRRGTTIALGAAIIVAVLALPSPASASTQISLVVDQGRAFSVLGHSCGGIQEKPYATGWAAGSGAPIGDVYMSTRCGGSGRGGGGGTTTYAAWVSVRWTFGGSVAAFTKLSTVPTVNPTFSASDAHGDRLTNQATAGVVNGTQVYTQALLVVQALAAPANVKVTPSGGKYQVTWTSDPTAPAGLVTGSTVTASPVNSTAPAVTSTVSGTTTSALIGPLQPLTSYQITVTSADPAGSSPAGGPVDITTGASTVPPAAPTGVNAHWASPGSSNDSAVVAWKAGASGDSPTDQYQVQLVNPDTGGVVTQTVAGSTLTTSIPVSDVPDYNVRVRAHDAAGWGGWSASYLLGGA